MEINTKNTFLSTPLNEQTINNIFFHIKYKINNKIEAAAEVIYTPNRKNVKFMHNIVATTST